MTSTTKGTNTLILETIADEVAYVSLVGIEDKREGIVLAITNTHIVVKWPAGKYWAANHEPWVYYSPETEVLTIIEETVSRFGRKTWRVDRGISWENTRKTKTAGLHRLGSWLHQDKEGRNDNPERN